MVQGLTPLSLANREQGKVSTREAVQIAVAPLSLVSREQGKVKPGLISGIQLCQESPLLMCIPTCCSRLRPPLPLLFLRLAMQ